MGRLKQFKEAEVLQKAMYTFWKHGYKKTTVRTLESEMGINQFSIYATFKNKEELFKKVLATYQQQLNELFLKDLQKQDCTLHEVQEFLTRFALSIARGEVPNSCLMVNSAREITQFDPDIRKIITGFFNTMKSHFSRALHNSIQMGLMNRQRSIDQCAEYLVGIAQSISVYSKIKSPAKIRSYIRFAVQVIKD